MGLGVARFSVLALSPLLGSRGQWSGAPPLILNPCTGEVIILRESNHLLPNLTSEMEPGGVDQVFASAAAD